MECYIAVTMLNDFLGQSIEREALGTGDDGLLHMIRPRADLEEKAGRTGVEGFARGLVERREAVVTQENDAVAAVHSLTKDGFLFGRDGGTHKDSPAFAASQPLPAQTGVFIVGIAAMDDDGHLVGNVKEKVITHGLAYLALHRELAEDGEKARVLTFDEKAPRVVDEIALPCIELALVDEDFVVIAFFEEAGTRWGCHLRKPPIGLVAARLETRHNMPEMFAGGEVVGDAEDDMQMVGHETQTPHVHHGVIPMHLQNFLLKDSTTERRRHHMRRLGDTGHRVEASLKRAEERLAVSHDEGEHIEAGAVVVVRAHAALHGGLRRGNSFAKGKSFFAGHWG